MKKEAEVDLLDELQNATHTLKGVEKQLAVMAEAIEPDEGAAAMYDNLAAIVAGVRKSLDQTAQGITATI